MDRSLFKSSSRALIAAFLTTTVFGTALGVSANAIAKDEKAAKAPEAPKLKLSKSALKLAQDAQKAMTANDFANARTSLAAIEALPTKTPDDLWYASQLLFDIAQKTNDAALRSSALEKMLPSPFLPADGPANTINRKTIYRIQIDTAYRAKDFAKAFSLGRAYYDQYPTDEDSTSNTLVYGLQAKDNAGVEAYARKVIAAKGGKAEEVYYKSIAEVLQKQKSPAFPAALVELIKVYPTTENWKYLLEDFQVRSRMIDRSGLDLFRLMMATGTSTSDGEISEAAQIAFDAGVPWEAKAWLQKGVTSGKVANDADTKDFIRRADAAITGDEPVAKQEARSVTEKTGNLDAGVGQVYLSQGNYAKAVDAFKRALSKSPRLRTEATIRMGIAQLMSGDKAAAKSTFTSVTGDAKFVELAKMWSLYADVKS
jgi:tetratricopeptide (TPR) repeat protein